MAKKSMLPLTVLVAAMAAPAVTHADPCGMVPPIYQGEGAPITRIGEQQTYVFYKDGLETFVIRPGFSGKVDEFGMLIPFPTPPAIRKVPDHIFEHIAAAIDPPEVVIDLRPRRFLKAALADAEPTSANLGFLAKDEVRVLREEAVGMYEVAVLAAGSSAALKRWMDDHGYRYPNGMDKACDDYVDDGWCFVAVKTKVGQKPGVEPRPGQRTVRSQLPAGASFDGFVQAMGFRFATDEFVVPMRLSAFNEGKLRNITYILADGPRRIRKIPEEYVVRQISGSKLMDNVTQLLPLRIIGGGSDAISPQRLQNIEKQRNPHPKNGAAKELFAADLLAATSEQLALPQEEQEKELLRIGERLGLRGADIDRINAAELAELNKKTVEKALQDIKGMTLSVVDGDFPREVIAADNLTFAAYVMPANKNSASSYDVKLRGPAPKREGVLKIGQLTPADLQGDSVTWPYRLGALSLLPLAFIFLLRRRRLPTLTVVALAAMLTLLPSLSFAETDTQSRIDKAIQDLTDAKTADDAVAVLVAEAGNNQATRERIVKALFDVAATSDQVAQRGWAITALSEIGGYDVDELLLKLHADESQSMLVRTWAAAGRVAMTRSAEGLIEKAQLIQTFPALGRPIGMRLVEKLNGAGDVSVEKLLTTTMKVPQIQQALAPAILAKGAAALVKVMTSANDQNVRRQATAYLGTLAVQGDDSVPKAVVQAYQFDPEADDVTWRGGPLFVPGINWQKDDARALAGNLIAWHLWCDRHGRDAEKRQIHNNLRSIALARAAGYERPRFQYSDTVAWLTTWGKALGKDAVSELLEIQQVADVPKYANVLNRL